MTLRVAPIDIDFAGWCEVPEGQHNAWGIINDSNELVVARKTRKAADEKRVAIQRGDA